MRSTVRLSKIGTTGWIKAEFEFVVDSREIPRPICFQMMEQKKQEIEKMFKPDAEVQFSPTQVGMVDDELFPYFSAEFKGIDFEDLKLRLNDKFPVILVKS